MRAVPSKYPVRVASGGRVCRSIRRGALRILFQHCAPAGSHSAVCNLLHSGSALDYRASSARIGKITPQKRGTVGSTFVASSLRQTILNILRRVVLSPPESRLLLHDGA